MAQKVKGKGGEENSRGQMFDDGDPVPSIIIPKFKLDEDKK